MPIRQRSKLENMIEVYHINMDFFRIQVHRFPGMTAEARKNLHDAFSIMALAPFDVQGTLQFNIWRTMIATLKIWKRYFWTLYERVQIKSCAKGGKGRERDRKDFEASFVW